MVMLSERTADVVGTGCLAHTAFIVDYRDDLGFGHKGLLVVMGWRRLLQVARMGSWEREPGPAGVGPKQVAYGTNGGAVTGGAFITGLMKHITPKRRWRAIYDNSVAPV